MKKYREAGEAGLTDKRGHHKCDDEVDELEHKEVNNGSAEDEDLDTRLRLKAFE